jgi:hypothetical protein
MEQAKKTRRWGLAAILAAGIAIGIAIAATPAASHVGSVTHLWNHHIKPKADKRYVRASGVLTIPGVAFVETRAAAPSSGSCVPETIAGDGTYYAPVSLPNGVHVTRLKHFWWDLNTGADSIASLIRVPVPSTSGPFTIASASSSGDAGTHVSSSTTAITGGVIANGSNTYFVRVTQPGSICVDAVQIFYTR